jgi:hypothetical protein
MAASHRKIEDQVEYREGALYWTNPRKKCLVGLECGHTTQQGYRRMVCQNRLVFTHRVIWFICTGAWPADDMDIDHINRNKLDNRIENLREVSRSMNAFNTGSLNVSKNRNGWRARVGQKSLGTFKTKEEAEAVARKYKETYLGTYYEA